MSGPKDDPYSSGNGELLKDTIRYDDPTITKALATHKEFCKHVYDEDCVFCNISGNPSTGFKTVDSPDSPLIFSSNHLVAFLDIMPLMSSTCHILLIPRAHVKTLDLLGDPRFPQGSLQSEGATALLKENKFGSTKADIAMAMGLAIPIISRAMLEVLGCTDFNVVQNNGHGAGQVVDHVHFHLIARRPLNTKDAEQDDLRQAVKGVTNHLKGEKSPFDGMDALPLRARLGYTSQVFGRNLRSDLNQEWAQKTIPKLRTKISTLLAHAASTQGIDISAKL
ncbi:HIT-like domain-containing protein [Yarrowia lipolytica]|jgi:diadenosine tetraphosphate (Ap4A) HIT family hydrolase|uniref:YALI0B15202p n=2 Tax=Yarrowia lipolytica TaxID=4952 RepID=Q6CEJ3_YARLI|nr:YALI0B15202p [Yarrowia lipolytica CLIB122]AOW01732.1 hypothetical protein YALI1_B20043g [Yarrowia lipolytica]KAB8284973.1 HIT-like domain-containing protein [Yarrowia lipolytica]KAE8175103.1 HIT-like domain-containing protein [Yarrowia lipolytica]KAJ8052529.1 HIT-like domain-containing protein [Yarrowia lipolytica]QNP97125.1 Adenylylsulfatase HINT3 [Yarrowia lipolytica]|eukprot:XP_500919.1 YALI0B15202p [Yarrowia lipolytica CLIB122]